MTARKIFGSGSPMGDLLITSAVYDDPADGPTVLHFPVPLKAPGRDRAGQLADDGHARDRARTTSLFEGVFVPEGAVSLRRPQGRWHPFFNVVATVAMPLVMSVYLGVAEAARDLALQQVARKRDDPDVWYLVGEMENALATGQMAVQGMVELCADYAFAAGGGDGERRPHPQDDRGRGAAAAPSRRRWRRSAAAASSAAWAWSGCCATSTAPSSTPCRRSASTASPAGWRWGSTPCPRPRVLIP